MVDPADITPDLPGVGSRIRVRTREGAGPELGTFTADTVPTAEQAEEVVGACARHVSLLLGRPGTSWDGSLEDAAKDVVASRAAWRIEATFYAEQASLEDSLTALRLTWEDERDALLATARDNQTGGWRMHGIRMVTSQQVLDDEAAAEAEA